jgi:chromosome segregation ATPase
MGQHDGYLDRMTTRLGDIEGEIAQLSQEHAPDEQGGGPPEVRELRAGLAAAKERLRALRRAGAELDDEMTRSFGQAFERLQAAVGRARSSLAGGTRAA